MVKLPATPTSASTMTSNHPYYPKDAILSGIFVPNSWSVFQLITTFAVGWAVILGTTLMAVRRVDPRLTLSNQALVLWFVLTGSIHCFFEGYFVHNNTHIASNTDFFAQLWKEYSLSDSRYMTSDPFLLCIETWTVLTWGPLSLLTAYLITTHSPYRHPTQALVSIGQFYGNLLYFSTSLVEDFYSGKKYYRPEGFYFWVYFVGMNSIWLVIPGWCLWSSIRETAAAFRVQSLMAGVDGRDKKRK